MRNWLRKIFKIEIPKALPLGEFEQWHSEMKSKNPIGYFLTENIFDFCYSIKFRYYYSFFYPLKNRLISKYHLIDTRLDKSSYFDIDERMLYGNFSLLQDFVEIELASMFDYTNNSEDAKYTNSQKGMKYCQEFFENYQLDKSIFSEEYETKIKTFYKEVYDLYNWWVYSRPIRISSNDLSGLYDLESKSVKSLADDEIFKSKCKDCHDIDQNYENEDQIMLERLIKIRRGLWT